MSNANPNKTDLEDLHSEANMLKTFHKKLVVDEQGNPMEVIIPWAEFVEIAELLGLDLNEEAVRDLEQARHDRDTGKKEAFLDINAL